MSRNLRDCIIFMWGLGFQCGVAFLGASAALLQGMPPPGWLSLAIWLAAVLGLAVLTCQAYRRWQQEQSHVR